MSEHDPSKSTAHEALFDSLDDDFQVVDSDDPKARQILAAAFRVPPINRSAMEPPFLDHHKNTKEMWKYVDDSTVKKYLRELFFMNTYGLKKECILAIENPPGQLIEVPTGLIVSASGFESWEGRSPLYDKSWESDYGHGHMSSINVIKHYAGLSTELPPVGLIRIFVQPDGRMFADNGSEDSHRIAAAMLRGDETIKTKEADVYKVERNYLDGPDEQS